VEFTGEAAIPEPSQEVAIAIYRVTQECMSNVARHSGSRQARVTLHAGPDGLHLAITDTGVGFDAERLPTTGGLGLVSIRERARMIGADVQITSAAVQGTTIELRVPLATRAGV
jgi:signal transduction histidine kinase